MNEDTKTIDVYALGFFRTAAKDSPNHKQAQRAVSEILKFKVIPHRLVYLLSILYDTTSNDLEFVIKVEELRSIFPESQPEQAVH